MKKVPATKPRDLGPSRGIQTLAVHGGDQQNPTYSLTTPLYLTSTYVFPDSQSVIDYRAGVLDHPEYGRYNNPTVRAAERKVAALENTEDACMFSSGMAAITAIMLALLKSGDHIVVTHDCYHGIRNLVTNHLARFGITHTIVKTGDWEALEKAIIPRTTKLLFTETPTNPYLNIVDLQKFVEVAKANKVKTAIDATFSTPVNTRPHDYGIDLVVHSGTKYLAGHNDSLSGVVTGREGFIEVIREFQHISGAVCSPFEAYMLIRGLKTLPLRVRAANQTALQLATFLEQQHGVKKVYYPLLPSHNGYEIAKQQMQGGGGVISFVLEGGLDRVARFCDALRIPQIAPSLGGPESLFQAVAMLSYGGMTPEERKAIGIEDGLIRYSVGLEDVADLQQDLAQALAVG